MKSASWLAVALALSLAANGFLLHLSLDLNDEVYNCNTYWKWRQR